MYIDVFSTFMIIRQFVNLLLRVFMQTVVRRDSSVPFESNYVPITQEASANSNDFPLESFLSNHSTGGNDDGVWTYFLLDVPYGATGGNIHVHLSADSKIKYELYARYGGLPSLSNWDYFYTNSTSNSNGSMFFKLYDSSEDTISFYMLYARGGTWSLGLRQLNPADSSGKTDISLSLERCPQKCSSHGSCQSSLDTTRLMLYRFACRSYTFLDVTFKLARICHTLSLPYLQLLCL